MPSCRKVPAVLCNTCRDASVNRDLARHLQRELRGVALGRVQVVDDWEIDAALLQGREEAARGVEPREVGWHLVVTLWLHCGYIVVTMWLRLAPPEAPCGYNVVTLWLQCGYNVVTLWLQCGYIVVTAGTSRSTMWLQCGYNVVIMWLRLAPPGVPCRSQRVARTAPPASRPAHRRVHSPLTFRSHPAPRSCRRRPPCAASAWTPARRAAQRVPAVICKPRRVTR